MSDIKKKVIKPVIFIVAALFLCNPNVNIVDLMPDFVGYLLLYTALAKVADLIPHFDEARERLHKLFWITLSKIPAMFIMLSISSQNTAERPIVAVFSFSYAIIELIYIYPAFSALFDGFEYLEERFGAEGEGKKNKVLLPPRKLTAVFFTIKMVCCSFPEFSLASVSDILGDVNYRPNIASFYPYFSALGAIVTIVVAIIWVIKFSKFVRYIARSRHIGFSLSSSYIEKRTRLHQIYKHRFVCLCMSLITFASLFGIDLLLDNKNYLPDTFSALLFTLAALVMLKFTSRARIPLIISILYAISTVCTIVLQKSFHATYIFSDIGKIIAAEKAYNLVIVSSVIEFALAAALLFSLAYCISELVKKTTGSPNENESALKYNDELHHSFKVQAYIMAVIGSIACLSTVIYNYLLKYTEKIEMMPEYSSTPMTMSTYGEFWIVVAVTSIVWVIYTYRLSHMIKEGAERKFEIETDF